MGPVGSPYARYGVELTDSEYVVINMRIATRMGKDIYPPLHTNEYVKCIAFRGAPTATWAKKTVTGPTTLP